MTEKELRGIVKVVLEESRAGNIHIDADTHYRDHLFISYWRETWDSTSKKIGALVLAVLLAAILAAVGGLVLLLDPKLIGLFK